jgi:hypothetical protein
MSVAPALQVCCRARPSLTWQAACRLCLGTRTPGLTHPASPCSLKSTMVLLCPAASCAGRGASHPRAHQGRALLMGAFTPARQPWLQPRCLPSLGGTVWSSVPGCARHFPPVAHVRGHQAYLDCTSHADVANGEIIIESGASLAPRRVAALYERVDERGMDGRM